MQLRTDRTLDAPIDRLSHCGASACTCAVVLYSESFLPPSMKNWTVLAIPGFCNWVWLGAFGGTFLKYFFFTTTPLKAGVLPTAPVSE